MSNSNLYIVYRTVADGAEGVGYVVNILVWTGSGTPPIIPEGQALAADPEGKYPIGSVYPGSKS